MPDGTIDIYIDSSFFEVGPGEQNVTTSFLILVRSSRSARPCARRIPAVKQLITMAVVNAFFVPMVVPFVLKSGDCHKPSELAFNRSLKLL